MILCPLLSLLESPGHRVCAAVELWACSVLLEGPEELGVCKGALRPLPLSRPSGSLRGGSTTQKVTYCHQLAPPAAPVGEVHQKPEHSGYPSRQQSASLSPSVLGNKAAGGDGAV